MASNGGWLDLSHSLASIDLKGKLVKTYGNVRLLHFLLHLFTCLFVLGAFGGFVDDLHKVCLKRLLLKFESILVPDKVGHLWVPSILLHASLKQSKDELVVWILSKLELSAVIHELLELVGMSFA